MVRSPLVAPLVKPLVAPRVGLAGATALARSGIGATALALSALVAVSVVAHQANAALEAEAHKSKKAEVVEQNPHKVPQVPPARRLATFVAAQRAAHDRVAARAAQGSVGATVFGAAALGADTHGLAPPGALHGLAPPGAPHTLLPDTLVLERIVADRAVVSGRASVPALKVTRFSRRLARLFGLEAEPPRAAMASHEARRRCAAVDLAQDATFRLFGSGTYLSGLPTT
jgi:hypothetical protein